MYIIYSPEKGKQVVRRISNRDDIPALIRTNAGDIGCWSCGARVCRLSANSMICIECGSRMAIGHGRTVKLSMTPDGAVLEKPALVGAEPQTIGVMENGDVAIFPDAGDPDFHPSDHDPIGCTALELLLEVLPCSNMRARA